MAHTPQNLALDHTILSHQRGTATGDFQEGKTVLKKFEGGNSFVSNER